MFKVRENIKIIRELRGMTQLQLANKIGCSQVSYSDFERGVSEISLKRFLKICEVLNMDTADILGTKTSRDNIYGIEYAFGRLSQKNKIKFIVDRIKELSPEKSQRIVIRLVAELKCISARKVIFAALRRMDEI